MYFFFPFFFFSLFFVGFSKFVLLIWGLWGFLFPDSLFVSRLTEFSFSFLRFTKFSFSTFYFWFTECPSQPYVSIWPFSSLISPFYLLCLYHFVSLPYYSNFVLLNLEVKSSSPSLSYLPFLFTSFHWFTTVPFPIYPTFLLPSPSTSLFLA